ncbi:hypothetical protein [Vagococcus jeotgali]|uniref:hypothetical protein n=1 Tax=Vagococcus jeotgali TaxID=3109030 RepID=UPI002DDAB991|nr:hypothetical protein [Vagococcus sp. B2T-5]
MTKSHYSQHGHLPVEVNEGRVSFNLDEILSKPHIKLNKSLLKEMGEIKEEIVKELDNNPHISYLYE